MLIGIVGKPSSGKTTLFNALCLTDAKTGSYPFTTIEPNRGMAFVRVECPCKDKEFQCQPRAGYCDNGTRYIQVEMLDVAGLVPGASSGKGMGNQFLDDLRQAHALIHVIDATGTTDAEGNQVDSYDPSLDVEWLNTELSAWIYNIVFKDWDRVSRKLDADRSKTNEVLTERLTGLGATLQMIKKSVSKCDMVNSNPKQWSDEQKTKLSSALREEIFPMVIAANKSDSPKSAPHIDKLTSDHPDYIIINTSGLAEYTLRKADKDGIIEYHPGNLSFTIQDEGKNPKILKIVNTINEKMLSQGISTGVIELLERAVYEVLGMIAVFPVEDPSHLTDHDGRILPDVFLVPPKTTAKEFAGYIHTDLANSFINAILVSENNKRISAAHELKNMDVIKIVSAAK